MISTETGAKLGTIIRYGTNITLQHRFTQKYVCSGRNGDLTLVVVRSGVAAGCECWYKLMPRIKLFVEGQRVNVNARVLLEAYSPSGPKQWISIRISEPKEDNGSVGGRDGSGVDGLAANEPTTVSGPDITSDTGAVLSLSNTKLTGVEIRLFAPGPIGGGGGGSGCLKGGDFVRLFHLEHNALLEVYRSGTREGIMHTKTRRESSSHSLLPAAEVELHDQFSVALFPAADGAGGTDGNEYSVASIWQLELSETNCGGSSVPSCNVPVVCCSECPGGVLL
jgi:hypothetical protein